MASTTHQLWIRNGKPWRLARPLAKLRDRLRAYGYTVYDIGNDDHLDSNPPEDHTPYSQTGWPIASPYGVGFAIDIMPPPAGKGLPTLQQLGAQMVADRNAGLPGISWLKYQNWEPDRDNGGRCYQDGWTPNHYRETSSDRGHIHQSGRSDMADSTVGDDYDPVARIRGGDDMSVRASQLIEGLDGGFPKLPDGTPNTLVVRRLRDEAWMAEVSKTLTALTAAAAAEKLRDSAEATEIAALRAAFSTLAGNATGTPLDTAAVLAAAREEGQKTRDLIQRRHEDELNELKLERAAEIAGLLAEVEALKAAGNSS